MKFPMSLTAIIRNEWAEDGTTLLLEAALANIRDEIADDFGAGTLKPFVEGEPIGTIKPARVDTRVPETPEKQWLRRIEECAILRASNNRRMARILEEG